MAKSSGKIRRLLVDAGLVTAEDWDEAAKGDRPAVAALLESHKLQEEAYFEVMGLGSSIAPLDLARVRPDPTAVEALPPEACTEHGVMPIAKTGDVLTVAVSDPFDVLLLDDLNILSGCRVRPILSHPKAIKEALDRLFDRGKAEVEQLLGNVDAQAVELQEEEQAKAELEIGNDSEDVPAVKLVNLVLMRALRDKASDIHIEPLDQAIRIRFRIDGRMVEIMRPPKSLLPALTSRLKIMANLDIAERFVPQDGKFQIRHENRKIDFRLSTLPVVGGEKAVMRILDSTGVAKNLASLGYEPKALTDIKNALEASYGMVLVTGPTGSGKSTTLYACVKEVATPEINCVTVEDPVEYRMEGINQVPVNPKRGLTFAGALRSILRQDPDVVLVGEIRDTETAEIAVKAALTGHLVLSTLHTNDAAATITRLVDMGIDRFMVSSSLICVCAQRLARVLCQHCKRPIDVPKEKLQNLGFLEGELEQSELFMPNPDGCPRCTGGYKGRFAILETLYLDNDIKRMVVEGKSAAAIKEATLGKGMLSLRRVGLLNALRGKTSVEEVLRVTMAD
jgi:type IV pilus assembly protein PilB